MDDDIDIEEHDVLDNPRIKSMFPDLSRVKIEVPDDDEMDAHNSEEFPEECPKIQFVYQYDYNSVTETDHTGNHLSEYNNIDNDNDEETANELQYKVIDQTIEDYCEPAESQSYIDSPNDMYVDREHCQNDSQPEYIPNKIIVGSKPNKMVSNYEQLYEEALNSQAVVYLENWEERLKASPCYCNVCETLFSTINALDAHKMVSHSYLIAVNNNTARKSTTSGYIIPPTQSIARKSSSSEAGRLCNHCNNVFPDDTTLIKHLYELLPLNNFTDNHTSVARNNTKIGVKIPVPETLLSHKKMDDKNLIKKLGVPSKIKSEVVIKTEYVKSNSVSTAVVKASVASSKIKKESTSTDPASVAIAKLIAKTKNTAGSKPYYKCTICHAILDNKRTAQIHRTLQHPTFRKLHIYHKIYKPDAKKKVRVKGKIDPSFIPISVLFKCGKCQIHLLSPYSALQHFIMCNKVSSKKCTICHRQVIRKDCENHNLQHDNSIDNIKVYTVNRSFYERVLCQCPTCGVCFEELPFWCHVICCTTVDSVYCSICNKKIAKTRYRTHEIKHRIRRFTKKDFIVIQYLYNKSSRVKLDTGVNECPPKMIVDSDRDVVKSDKKVMFYCPHCKCCQKRQNLKGHADRQCVKWTKSQKRVCDKCGLMFSLKPYATHRHLHEGDQFKLSDYEFVNIITATRITPPITPAHECKVCKVNFIRITQLSHHSCGEEEFHYCSICGKKFHPKAFSIHKQIHSDVEIMPELLLKYDSLFSTWNLMYMCIECDIVCLSYDTAVEHSQKHINYATDTSIYCDICNLTIHESYYRVHADLHETNSRLTVDSFKILKYDYNKLFHDDWMDYGDLTQQDVNVILSKSVYRYVKNVKMNATGDSDAVKYYCCNCKISVDDVKSHLDGGCKDNEKYRCKYCRTKMDDLNDLVTHELRHENTRNEFKIVSFNDVKDRKFNAKLKKYSSKSEKHSRKREKKIEKEKRYKAYCCRKCNVCLTLKQNMRMHRCLTDPTKKYFCKLCNQYFTYKFRTNHEIAHEKFPGLSKKTLSIIYFNHTYEESETSDLQDMSDPHTSKIFKIVKSNDDEDTKLKLKLKPIANKIIENDKKYKVYCCKNCEVCVTLKQNMAMHKCKVKKYYCNKCNQYFSYNFRANHERAHINFPYLSKKTVAVTYFGDATVNAANDTAILYKCDCNIHYNSLKSIRKHTSICKSTNVVKEKCTKCGLFFSLKGHSSHMQNHNKEFVIKNVIRTNWYQCPNCEILFLTENEVAQHHDTCDPELGVKCHKCEYKYLRNCINSHKCCETETKLYISTITKVTQDLKEFTVYCCTKCDINYWSIKSYQKHVGNNHRIRRKKVFCKICKLLFTKISNIRHSIVHTNCKEYKIKVLNPITNQYKVLRGNNIADKKVRNESPNTRGRNKIDESDADSCMDITRCRKRKIDSDNYERREIDSPVLIIGSKKTKVSKNTSLISDNDAAIDREDNNLISDNDAAIDIEGNSALITQERNRTRYSNSTPKIMKTIPNQKSKGGLYKRNNNTLYKCPKCPLHYLQLESLKSHMTRHENRTVEHVECAECHLKFTVKILKKHKYLQHQIHTFNLEDLEIKRVDVNKHGICVEVKNQSQIKSLLNDSNTGHDVVDDSTVASVFNDSNTEIESSIDDVTQDSVFGINNRIDENEYIEASTIDVDDTAVAMDNSRKEIRLFKCGNCNVCFITQNECIQHVDKHDTIDSKCYINCKICSFQFMIGSLKLHMETHHEKEFKLEDLMIEEYTVFGDGLDTKIDVYYAIDRVQSRLISTTTDEGKDDL